MNVTRRVTLQILTRPGLTNKVCRGNLQQESATSQLLIHATGVVLVEKLCDLAASERAEAAHDDGFRLGPRVTSDIHSHPTYTVCGASGCE